MIMFEHPLYKVNFGGNLSLFIDIKTLVKAGNRFLYNKILGLSTLHVE